MIASQSAEEPSVHDHAERAELDADEAHSLSADGISCLNGICPRCGQMRRLKVFDSCGCDDGEGGAVGLALFRYLPPPSQS